jgi:hypothetical protein
MDSWIGILGRCILLSSFFSNVAVERTPTGYISSSIILTASWK